MTPSRSLVVLPQSSAAKSPIVGTDLEDLDSDFIVDSLADLHRESTNIIRFFDHPTEDAIPALLEAVRRSHVQRLADDLDNI